MCKMMCTLISINYDVVSLSWLPAREKLMQKDVVSVLIEV